MAPQNLDRDHSLTAGDEQFTHSAATRRATGPNGNTAFGPRIRHNF